MTISIGNSYTSGTAGTIQYSALTSDTNWTDLVDELMQIERFHINRLNTWREDWSTKITALQGLDARLLVLKSFAGDLNTADEFYSRSAASSDEDVLTATTAAFAAPGAHTVTVGSDINHRLASQGWADESTTAVGDSGGDLVIQVGTQGTITIADADISAATTLQDLRDLINGSPENTGAKAITASIMHDGSNINPYRLLITAENGGPAYTILVPNNPTNLNFYTNDISPADTTNLTASTTTAMTTSGSFTGDKSTVGATGYRTYTFTGPADQQIIGSGDWTISWVGDGGGGTGTINLGNAYTANDTIEIEDGVFISFDSGVFEGGNKTFTVKAFSSDIDAPEYGTWNGTATVTSDGNYLGSTNKTFTFTVSGTDTVTVGTDSFEMQWTDTEGNSGLISVSPTAYTDIEVYQGIKISLAEGTVEGNDTFSVDVTNTTIQSAAAEGLAQAEVETHSGFVDENTSSVTTVDGTFSYTYGGVTRTLVVPANATLLDLRNLINNDGSNPGVTAAILNDGSGLSTAFHLQLSGNHSGAAYTINSITHSLDNFARGGSSGYGFTQTQEAHNAFIKVDGYPPDGSEYIQRSSNTIADLVSGVTLNLSSAGSATVSITTDVSAIKAKIETFVESINAALDFIKEMTTYDQNGAGENNGPMIGNYAFQIVQHRINAILSTAVPGLVDGVDDYTNLSQIGIATDPDQNGKWVIDETLLNTALNTDIESVCSLFIQNETTGIDGMAELIYAETENLTESYSDANPGIVSVLIENYEGIIDNIDAKIEREERRLALVENRLNTKYSRLEVLLGQLEGQTAFLTSLIESLNGTGQD